MTLQFVPDADAQAAYEAHTRRKWRDSNSTEETLPVLPNRRRRRGDRRCRMQRHTARCCTHQIEATLRFELAGIVVVECRPTRRTERHRQRLELLHAVSGAQAVCLFGCVGCCCGWGLWEKQQWKSIFSEGTGMHLRHLHISNQARTLYLPQLYWLKIKCGRLRRRHDLRLKLANPDRYTVCRPQATTSTAVIRR